MDLLLDHYCLVGGERVVREEWPHGLQVFGLEGGFHCSWTRLGSDYCVGWVGWAEGAHQVLPTQEIQAIFDRKNLSLRVKVSLGGPFVAASCDPEGRVLDGLEPPQIELGGVWGPDGGSIGKD